MATILTIGGTAQPRSNYYKVTKMPVYVERKNANGYTLLDFITTKDRIDVVWSYLTDDQWAALLLKLNTATGYITVIYWDSKLNVALEGTFRCVKQEPGNFEFDGTNIIGWNSVAVTLEEA